jgi:alpha-ketoglutarate-dependent taurine dioxygenase
MKVCTLDQADPEAISAAVAEHGVVLLRNQAIDADRFEALTQSLCRTFHHVSTRDKLRSPSGDGFTTEVIRKNFILLAHSEGAYRPHAQPPSRCFFLCLTPPEAAGGETTLVDGAEMARMIPGALRQRLQALGIVYECHWDPERWRVEFALNSRDELCQLLDGLPQVEYRLEEDDHLHLFYSAPAIHGSGEATVFCNGLLTHLPAIHHPRYHGLPVYANPANRVWLGDGSVLTDDMVNALIDAHDAVVYRHRWCRHDLLIIDNHRVMHGREMTAEPCDRVLVSRFGW